MTFTPESLREAEADRTLACLQFETEEYLFDEIDFRKDSFSLYPVLQPLIHELSFPTSNFRSLHAQNQPIDHYVDQRSCSPLRSAYLPQSKAQWGELGGLAAQGKVQIGRFNSKGGLIDQLVCLEVPTYSNDDGHDGWHRPLRAQRYAQRC